MSVENLFNISGLSNYSSLPACLFFTRSLDLINHLHDSFLITSNQHDKAYFLLSSIVSYESNSIGIDDTIELANYSRPEV